MIRIAKSTKTLLMRLEEQLNAKYWHELQCDGGELSALIVECLRLDGPPRCPRCLEANDPAECPAGAGLLVCNECIRPYLALRLLGGKCGFEWYVFPWPE